MCSTAKSLVYSPFEWLESQYPGDTEKELPVFGIALDEIERTMPLIRNNFVIFCGIGKTLKKREIFKNL